jgi:hypothetical protein
MEKDPKAEQKKDITKENIEGNKKVYSCNIEKTNGEKQ